MTESTLGNPTICIVGLGYVGLPLAVAFGSKIDTIGFDINAERVQELKDGVDKTLECDAEELASADRLRYTADVDAIREASIYIVTVPTPVDDHKRPDLSPLESASRMLGNVIGKGDIVVYESTVYPGATEEVCVPLLEAVSGLKWPDDFHVGYSPERINPGDKEHRLHNIKKVVAGDDAPTLARLGELYELVIEVGVHRAPTIKVAEAAKVIENTQRDINIALINELAMLFNKLGIDSEAVLEAAGTKWNFLPFRPGLVGGHCIGVDPYYLTHKAAEIGFHPSMILAGRRTNDGMGRYVAEQIVRLMVGKRQVVAESRVLILGLTFKENCPDLRNTRVVDVIQELTPFGPAVDIHDPWVDPAEAKHEYGLDLIEEPEAGAYDAIVLAVSHEQFKEKGLDWVRSLGKPDAVVYDVKHLFPADQTDGRL